MSSLLGLKNIFFKPCHGNKAVVFNDLWNSGCEPLCIFSTYIKALKSFSEDPDFQDSN